MLAYFLFAAQSVILERKLSQFNPGAVLVVLYATTIPLVIGQYGALKLGGGEVIWPTGWNILWVAVAAACYFFGDKLLINAYSNAYDQKVDYLNSIVLTAILFPVFAVVIKYFWTRGQLPNRYFLGAFALAAVMVYLVVKGQNMQDAAAKVAASVSPSGPDAP